MAAPLAYNERAGTGADVNKALPRTVEDTNDKKEP
jgi:hypothetical protein